MARNVTVSSGDRCCAPRSRARRATTPRLAAASPRLTRRRCILTVLPIGPPKASSARVDSLRVDGGACLDDGQGCPPLACSNVRIGSARRYPVAAHREKGEADGHGRGTHQGCRTQHLLRRLDLLLRRLRGPGAAQPLVRDQPVDRRGRADRGGRARQARVGAQLLHQLPQPARRGRLLRPRARQCLDPLRRPRRPAGRARGAEGLDPVHADRHPGPTPDAAASSSPTRSTTTSRASWSGSARSTRKAGRPTRLARGPSSREHAQMRYASQKVAYWYFVCALGLFLAQVLFGVLAGTVYVFPNFLSELVPFHILRMIHTNALIVWLLLGFFGATYYLLPEEAEREIHSTRSGLRPARHLRRRRGARGRRLPVPDPRGPRVPRAAHCRSRSRSPPPC